MLLRDLEMPLTLSNFAVKIMFQLGEYDVIQLSFLHSTKNTNEEEEEEEEAFPLSLPLLFNFRLQNVPVNIIFVVYFYLH